MLETGGRYERIEPLGKGGSATAYRAFDRVRAEEVALKVVRAGLEETLEHELDLLGRISHPCFPAVYDFGRLDSGQAFYAARLVRGTGLGATQSWDELAPVLVDVLDGLFFLHRAGVRHGDVKPDNIVVEERRGVLLDLGCAAPIGAVAHSVSGTPGFLAPEILAGHSVDGRGDVFAFGRMLRMLERDVGTLPTAWASLASRACAEAPRERPDAREALELVGAGARALAPLPPECARLVGRDAILARFDAALIEFLEGRAGTRAFALSGEPGSGRTRVVAELKRRAQKKSEVIEASVRQRAPIASLLARSGTPGDGIQGALAALGKMREDGRRRVWILDDADRLAHERRAFEALIRALAPNDPLFVIASTERSEAERGVAINRGVWGGSPPRVSAVAELEGEAVERVQVGPLDAAAIAEWAHLRIEPRDVAELARASGGHAATVRWLLGGGVAKPDLREAIGRLAPSSRQLVALLAAAGTLSLLDARALFAHALGSTFDPSEAAHGFLRLDGDVVRLARPADAAAILAASSDRAAIHRALAHFCQEREEIANAVRHAFLAGEDADPVLAMLGRALDTEGMEWRETADALARAYEPRLRLAAAKIFERNGESARAVELYRTIDRTLVGARLGACLLKLERAREALDELRRVTQKIPNEGGTAADLMCRAHIKLGEYDEAIERATRALEIAHDPPIRAALEEDLGVALSYRGEKNADTHLREAERILAIHGGARERMRVASYLAIDAYRRGQLAAAREGYVRALAIAEEHRLDDQIAHAALNLATVHHQCGEYWAALEAYRRGHRMAHALDQKATLATIELDCAQLYVDIGAFERARATEERARALASAGGFVLLSAACTALCAQIAMAAGEMETARVRLDEARSLFTGRGAERELAELELLEARVATMRGDAAGAATILRSLGELADDVAVRRDLALGRLLRDRALLEHAASEAERIGHGALRAELEGELASMWAELGAGALAQSHERQARECWERIGAGLETALAEAFWAHPLRAKLSRPTREASDREGQLEKLLAINRKLSSTLAVDDVLHQAMDAAIELTGAERGFLIVRREDGALHVPVARNLDRERIGRSHLKFSRSIAERAIETGELVVTVDARSDERFAENASVHAMKLRSVIAVPIPSPDGIVGAMYLDNRFARARFAAVATELLTAFADQVAIALANARRTEELARRTEELERERARVEALSRGQAAQIERLSAALAERQEALERRYDYGALSASSAAMQPVIATLEKVIASPLSVLVAGESGTGKELVARAVHFNSPRKDGAFVTVNCAALPDALLESELFGHVRGAFTGADRDREGLMVAAEGGTLFLDEVGETSLAMQAKLLRALEQREVRPVGGTRAKPVDFRLVCATNRVLAEEVHNGRFREDLYYRIGVVEVRLPPLRERLEDIPELARRILARAAEELGRPVPALRADAMKLLLTERWPGNVRQLQNVLRTALVMADTDVLEPRHLAPKSLAPPPRPAHSRAERDERERVRILEALDATDWNATLAAQRVGVSRATFYRKLAKYRIETSRNS